MSNRVTCPHCNVNYRLSPEYDGKAVRCTTCQQTFRVPVHPISEPAPSDPRATTQPAPEEPIIPEMMEETPAKKDDDEIIDIREAQVEKSPRPSSRRSRDRDDDDVRRGRPRRKDEYDRPSISTKKTGSQGKTAVRAVLGGIVLLVLVIFKIWLALNRDKEDKPVVVNPPQPQLNFPNNPNVGFPNPNGFPQPKFNFPKGGFPKADREVPFMPVGPARPIETAPVVALEIKPSEMKAEKEEYILPGRIEDVCVGGGGRYLLFKLFAETKIAIFDVVQAKVVKIVPSTSINARIAAGMDKWVVVDTGMKMIQRWSFKTFEREAVSRLHTHMIPAAVAMGSSSNGPVAVISNAFTQQNERIFLDLDTLTSFNVPDPGGFSHFQADARLRASANGTMITWKAAENEPVQTVVVKNQKMQTIVGDGGFLPSADALRTFAAGIIFDDRQHPLTRNFNDPTKRVWFVPAVEGKYYLSITAKTPFDPKSLQVGIHLDNPEHALATRTDITGLDGLAGLNAVHSQHLEKQFFLIPDAKVLAVVPASKDRVVLYKWDVDALLPKAEKDYLFVTSRPTQPAVKGRKFSYQLRAAAKTKDIQFRKVNGPAEAKVNELGLITWDVPADEDEEATIVVEVSAGVQKLTHEVRLPVYEKDDPILELKPQPWVALKQADPVENSFGIRPPKLENEAGEFKFDSPIQDFSIGGGGRYFIFHLPKEKRLDLFDVNELKVVKSLPLESNKALFAAGKDRVMIVYPDTKRIERWSLHTYEKELGAEVPYANITAVAMGSAANDRLALAYPVNAGSAVVLLDSDQLKSGIVTARPGVQPNPNSLRASANGRLFTIFETLGGNPVLSALRFDNGMVKFVEGQYCITPGTPNADGNIIYASVGSNQFTSDLLFIRGSGHQDTRQSMGQCSVPAVHGRYYLTIDGGLQSGRNDVRNSAKVAILAQGSNTKIGTLPEGRFSLADRRPPAAPFISAERCIQFIPDAKLVLVIGRDLQRIGFTAFDAIATLDKAGLSRLNVTSQPIKEAKRGAQYVYQLQVDSNRNGIKAKFAQGPIGMKISEDGQVVWEVPANHREMHEEFSILLTDASGMEVYHNFTVRVKY